MIHRFCAHIRQNAVAYVALFVALGGTSYAAVSLPRNSVGTRQLRAGSVTPAKLNGSSFGGHILYSAKIALGGRVISSSPKGATTVDWLSVLNTYSGGEVRWHRPIPGDCFAFAGTDASVPGGQAGVPVASAELVAGSATKSLVDVGMPYDAPVSVAVICPN